MGLIKTQKALISIHVGDPHNHTHTNAHTKTHTRKQPLMPSVLNLYPEKQQKEERRETGGERRYMDGDDGGRRKRRELGSREGMAKKR